MSEKKKNEETTEVEKPFHHPGHTLKTRRDFLAQGFLGMTAFALAPEILVKGARAQSATGCMQVTAAGLTPVIIIDLAGGGNIPGSNVIVGGAAGQMNFLQTYSSLGLNANEHPSLANMVNQDLGLAFHSGSGILQGIKDIASVTTQAQMDGTLFATISNDDTANNQHNPMYWLNKAGAKGTLNQLAGTRDSVSGGNSNAPLESINPSIAPVKISNRNDAMNLVSLGNSLTNSYNNDQIETILEASGKISTDKIKSIPRRSLPEAIKNVIECGFGGANEQVKKFQPGSIDPNLDTDITPIFNRITNAGVRDSAKPIVKLVLDGLIGSGTIMLGGYDYHDATRVTGDRKDREVGQLIGAIVETAAAKQKDVVIYVITDGGVGTNGAGDPNAGGRMIWTGDNAERSSSFMMVYKKDGKPRMRNSRRQIGYFQANGAVNPLGALTSNSVVNTAKAMVANYLALHGLEGQLERVVGDDPFRLQLDNYLMFDKLR